MVMKEVGAGAGTHDAEANPFVHNESAKQA
jgi:hypothetical protein